MTKILPTLPPLKQVVYILRGVPGAGKSTLALELVSGNSWLVFEADKFHMIDGIYQWKPENTQKAHEQCFKSFCDSIDQKIGPLVVANTNTTEKEFDRYADYARQNDYTVFSVVLENRHNGQNIHSVPEETLEKMEQRLRSSLKLR